MTKKISWLVSLSCIVLVLMLSIVFVGCKDKKYDLKIESSMGGNVSISIDKKGYQIEDLESETFKVKENAVVTLKATAKTGYEFEKWILNDGFSYSDELKININTDSTYVAVFKQSTYSVIFKHNGNTVGTVNINVASNLNDITYPTIEGYDNVVWEEIAFDATNPANVVVNTISADLINYTITFKAEDNSEIKTINWNVEDKDIESELPSVPTKVGYTAEWEAYNLNTLQNIEVKPVYSVINYTLTFMNGDFVIETQNISVETDLDSIEYPSMSGYENVEWEEISFDKANPDNVVVKTTKADLKQYTLTFTKDDQTIATQNITVETDLDSIDLPEIAGYSNIVWGDINFDKENPSDVVVEFESADLINYTLTFKRSDGFVFGEKVVTVESDLTAITLEVPGYEDIEWSQIDFDINDPKDTDVICTATLINYNATFKSEDGTTIETLVWNAEDKDFTAPVAPAKEGYTAEWEAYDLDTYTDFEVNPVYTIINYTITFKDEEGNVVQTSEWNVENKTVTAPEVPAKVGFNGSWGDYDFDTLQDINVAIVYSKSMYVKYFYDNGNTYQGTFDGNYTECDLITIIKTTKTEDGSDPVSTVLINERIAGRDLVTIEEFVEYLSGYSSTYELVKIGESTDLAQGVMTAFESAASELNVYFG